MGEARPLSEALLILVLSSRSTFSKVLAEVGPPPPLPGPPRRDAPRRNDTQSRHGRDGKDGGKQGEREAEESELARSKDRRPPSSPPFFESKSCAKKAGAKTRSLSPGESTSGQLNIKGNKMGEAGTTLARGAGRPQRA